MKTIVATPKPPYNEWIADIYKQVKANANENPQQPATTNR